MEPKDELVARWQRWQRSIEERDVETAASILDDDYALQLVQPGTAAVGRAEWLAMLPSYVVTRYAVHAAIVDIDGDVATILHRADMTAAVAGVDRSGTFVLTDVWRRREGAWRVWRRHSTPLSAGALPRSDPATDAATGGDPARGPGR